MKNTVLSKLKKTAYGIVKYIVLTIIVDLIAASFLGITSINMYFSSNQQIPNYVWVYIVLASVLILICLITLCLYIVDKIKSTSTQPKFPRLKINRTYLALKYEMFFKSRTEIECIRYEEFVVLSKKISEVPRNTMFSGTSYIGTSIDDNAENYTIKDVDRDRSPYSYTVLLNRDVKCNEIVRYTTRSLFEDKDLSLVPMFNVFLSCPSAKIDIKVTVPKGLIHNVKKGAFADHYFKIPISDEEYAEKEQNGNMETYKYSVETPHLLYNYRITWDFR